jgi:hypothetical protein
VEQADPEAPLDLAQAPEHRRMADSEPPPGPGKRAGLGNGEYHAQVVPLQRTVHFCKVSFRIFGISYRNRTG